jgi:hypothetical protein
MCETPRTKVRVRVNKTHLNLYNKLNLTMIKVMSCPGLSCRAMSCLALRCVVCCVILFLSVKVLYLTLTLTLTLNFRRYMLYLTLTPTPSLPSSDLKKNPLISELHLVRVGVRIRMRGKIRVRF